MNCDLKLSILMPCYNCQKYIDEALESVIKQTYKNIEIICINDGSTDKTLEKIQEYAKKDERIRIIDKKNTGYGQSMNKGLAESTGDYIGILEPDDFYEVSFAERLLSTACENDLDIARACYNRIEEATGQKEVCDAKNVQKNVVIRPIEDKRVLYQPPSIWCAIYKSSFLRDNGIKFLETPGASFQDTSFSFKTYAMAERFMMIPDVVMNYRVNSSSSVKDAGKIFCIADEYKEIWQFARSHKDYEKLKFVISKIQLEGYKWNFNRLNREGRIQFFELWRKTLREQLKDGALSLSNGGVKKIKLVTKVAFVPKGLLNQMSFFDRDIR